MKQWLFGFLCVTFSVCAQKSDKTAEKYNDVTLAQKLRNSTKSLKEQGDKFFKSNEDHLMTFQALENSVKIAEIQPSEILMSAIVAFSGEMALLDNGAVVGRILLPLWRGPQKQKLKAQIERLAPPQKLELLRQIQVRLQEDQEGNG